MEMHPTAAILYKIIEQMMPAVRDNGFQAQWQINITPERFYIEGKGEGVDLVGLDLRRLLSGLGVDMGNMIGGDHAELITKDPLPENIDAKLTAIYARNKFTSILKELKASETELFDTGMSTQGRGPLNSLINRLSQIETASPP